MKLVFEEEPPLCTWGGGVPLYCQRWLYLCLAASVFQTEAASEAAGAPRVDWRSKNKLVSEMMLRTDCQSLVYCQYLTGAWQITSPSFSPLPALTFDTMGCQPHTFCPLSLSHLMRPGTCFQSWILLMESATGTQESHRGLKSQGPQLSEGTSILSTGQGVILRCVCVPLGWI